MTIEELANAAIDLCESQGPEFMVTGALAFNFYGIPRSTKDVDRLETTLGSLPEF